jgi:zinc protease
MFFFLYGCKSLTRKNTKVDETTPKETVQTKPSADYIPVDKDVRIGKLPNGMTYYIRRNTKPENKVEMRLAVNAGSILEDDDQQGLAHFMEHMNFNGLKHFHKNELVDFLQKMGVRFGADLNAYTGFDETVYMLPIPLDNPENLDKGLLVLHDWAYFADLDSVEIEKERGVVLEEYRLGLGAGKRMMNKWLPVLLKDSRYARRLPIGKKDILEHFPHAVLKRFHKDWYRPDLEAVIIVGDIDPDTVEAKIKKMFSEIPASQNPRERKIYDVPPQKGTMISVADDPEAMYNEVTIYYKDREKYHPDKTVSDYKESLEETLFSQMLSNRLEDLKEKNNPPFSYAWAYYGSMWARTAGAFQVAAITDAGKHYKALETLLTEAKRVKEYGFTPAELERAKKDLMTRMEQQYKNRNTTESQKLIWKYVDHFLSQEPIPSIQWEYDMYKFFLPQIQLGDVNKFAKKFIHDDNRVIVITGKRDKNIKPVTEEEVWQVINRVDQMKVKPYEETQVAAALMQEKPRPGKIVKTETDDELGTRTYYLENGAVVVTKKTGFKESEVKFMAFKTGGKTLLGNQTFKKTYYAMDGIAKTSKLNGFDKTQLRKILAGKKADVRASVGRTSSDIYADTRPEDLETALQKMYLYFTALQKDPQAYESWKQRQAAFLSNIANSPNYKFLKALSKFANKNNPRYMPILPGKEDFDTQDFDLAYQKFREFFDGASGYHFYIIGNFDENRIEDFIKTYIASLPASGRKATYIDRGYPILRGHNEFIYHAGKEPKSMVYIQYYDEVPYKHSDELKLDILSQILTNKLIENIREKESGVYGIRAKASMKKIPHPSYVFTISFPCGPENSRRLAGLAEQELQKLITEGPSQEDLEKVIKSMLLQFDENLKTNGFWMDYLSNTDYLELPPHRINDYKQKLQALTPKDIREVARKYLKNPKNRLLAIWYPEGFEEK